MLGPMVLLHALGTGILLTTVRTCHLTTSNTSRSVPSPHFLTTQHLNTLVTWVLLPSVHPHVYCGVFKGLLTYQTVLGFPRNSRNLEWDFSNLPGLSTLRKVFPTKKSWHLLLDPFQRSLLYHTLITSRMGLHQSSCRNLYQYSCRTNKPSSWTPHMQQPGPPPHPHWTTQPVSSSLSEGWSLFQAEIINSKHSNTNLRRSSLAKTEMRNETIHSTAKLVVKWSPNQYIN